MESQAATITVGRPQDGETLTVAITQGLRVVLEFNPAAASFAIEGDDFVLTLEGGGQVVFAGLVSAAQGAEGGGDVPTIQVGGTDIGADVLMKQALALGAETEAEPIETAAGEEGEGEEAVGGGGSSYEDSFGELIAGLIQQGIIGETDLDFGLIGNGATEFLVEAEFLSDGSQFGGSGGFGSLGVGILGGPDSLAGTETPGSGVGSPDPLPDIASVSDGGEVDTSYTIIVSDIEIITNEATGNLEIPDELILYLTDTDVGGTLSVTGPSNGGGNNAKIWDFGAEEPGSPNTWANHGTDSIKIHLDSGGTPTYEGSLTYEVADGLSGTGVGDIGVVNVATAKAGGYWTLDQSASTEGEVLLGLDGRNQIDGGSGDDIIHGGHDSSGDILRGNDGDDVIFGGGGNDDLQGGAGADTFLMSAGFGRDDVDGGGGDEDVISLDSVLTGANVADSTAIDSWLTLNGGAGYSHDADAGSGTITFTGGGVYSGTIDLGGGDVITFTDVEQIVYTDLI